MTAFQNKLKLCLQKQQLDGFIQHYETAHGAMQTAKADSKLQKQYLQTKQVMKAIDNILPYTQAPLDNWLISHLSLPQSYIAIRKQTHTLQARYQITLTQGLEHLCQLLATTSAYKLILPFCQDSKDIRKNSPLEKDVLVRFKIPILNERHLLLKIIGVDRIDHNGTIVFYGQGVPKQEAERMVKGLKGEYLKMRHFICEIKVDKDSYTIRTYSLMDSSLNYLPEWIINKIIRLIGSFLINKFVTKISQPPTAIEEEEFLQENQRFHVCLRARLKEKGWGVPRL